MRSVLIITAAPDTRASTQQLRDTFAAIDRRNDVRAETWFLRCAWNEVPWDHSKVVDNLRTWPPAVLLERVGAQYAAARLRGVRLATWMRRLSPDVIVMDDGLGERLLSRVPNDAAVVVRLNPEAPADLSMEAPTTRRPTAYLCQPGVTPRVGPDVPVITEFDRRDDYDDARRAGTEPVRMQRRERLGLPVDAPVVTGWGDEGWLDGPDLFIRVLWALEARHGIRASGAWFGSDEDESERARLNAEAQRCGLAQRFHHLPPDDLAARVCGDVVLLPYRDRTADDQLLLAACSGAPVVTFPVTTLTDPSIRVVPHLDIESAATSVAEALAEDRQKRWSDARHRLDLQSLVDLILGLTAAQSR